MNWAVFSFASDAAILMKARPFEKETYDMI
jgi:hypothetical protein